MNNPKQIYISESSIISYDDSAAYDNNQPIIQDNPTLSISPENLAQQRMRNAYKKVFSKQYDNLIVLSGAGTSVGIGVGSKYGKTMKGLWDSVVSHIGYPKLESFAKKIGFRDINPNYTDLEAMISRALLAETYNPRKNVQDILKRIKAIIRDECELILPDNSPHSVFLQKITARKTKYNRAKIFTLNYDLLFEQAASRGGYVVIDGFSFTIPRTFRGVNFDWPSMCICDMVCRILRRRVIQ